MQKPSNYDETKATGGWTPVALGGHKAIIKGAEETETKNGKPMVKVFIDFDKGDEQEGYFAEDYKNNTKEDKKWAFAGTLYIVTEDDNGCTRKFKSFITALENSNAGFQVAWGTDLGKQIKGKKIGIVYGEEESEYDGRTSMRRVWKYTCDYAKALDQSIPAPKYLNNKPAVTDSDGFMSVGGNNEEDLPF